MVDGPPHPDGPVDEIADERTVARFEIVLAQQLRNEDVRERTVVDAQQRLGCESAGGNGLGRHASTRASPRKPARQAVAVIARLPSGCTSSSTSALPAAAPSTPSAV